MNLFLGNFIPLANERKAFLKVPTRLQYQYGLKALRFQDVLDTFKSHKIKNTKHFCKLTYLLSNLVDIILKFDDCYVKLNKSFLKMQKRILNSFKMNRFVLLQDDSKTNDAFVRQASLNSNKNTSVKTPVLAKPSLGFFINSFKDICVTHPCNHLNLAFYGQPFARLHLAYKETVKPSEKFSLLGLVAQNLASSPLEHLRLNPELF